MACYKRIYYVDYVENGVRQSNAGFIKLVQWKEKGETSFQLYISNMAALDAVNCKIKLVCGHGEIVLGQISVENGKGMCRMGDFEESIRSLDSHGGVYDVVLRVEIKAECCCESVIREGCGVVSEKNVTIEAAESNSVPSAESLEPIEESWDPSEDILEPTKPTPKFVPGIRQVKSDKWQQLWEVLPHRKPFDDEREYLQVELQDMIVLSGLFYKLVENSFLLHGYYNYGHLILTKISKAGKEKIYVGVPGNYYVKEAQVAVMFGFESFEPKLEPPKEGDFGYYMISVDI